MHVRGRRRWLAALLVSVALTAGCTVGEAADQTVIVTVTTTPGLTTVSSSGPVTPSAPTTTPTAATEPPTSGPPSTSPTTTPGGFLPVKLEPGQKPPQFIIVSFDGVGWHEKFEHWFEVGRKVPFRFTGFLSGIYLLSDQTRNVYQGPGHSRGKASIAFNAAEDLPDQINDLNTAHQLGNEIGTHFNGHFCDGAEPSGNRWSLADWNNELDQFFALIRNVKQNNPGQTLADLAFDGSVIKGARTQCLEGRPATVYPALTGHGLTYDSSFPVPGIQWPKYSTQYKIWQIGVPTFQLHGTTRGVLSMDYNYYFAQRNGSSAGVTPAQSAEDSEQVELTYVDMYQTALATNRGPLILGNHFNTWNNNAYENALTNFLLDHCGKPETHCVPFRDLIAWMELQDPSVLAALQAQPAENKPR